jgi:hypothetical protein
MPEKDRPSLEEYVRSQVDLLGYGDTLVTRAGKWESMKDESVADLIVDDLASYDV